jgi:hypothetical protein
MATKTKSNAWYAGLTVAQCDESFALIEQLGYAKAGEAVKAKLGLSRQPGQTALFEFRSRWPMRRAFLVAGDVAAHTKELLAGGGPEIDPERMEQIGQAVFTAAAVQQQDAGAFALMKTLRQKDIALEQDHAKTEATLKQRERALELESRRVALLEQKAAAYDRAQQAVAEAKQSKGGITPETLAKIEAELRLL